MWTLGDPKNKKTAAEVMAHNKEITAAIQNTMKGIKPLKGVSLPC